MNYCKIQKCRVYSCDHEKCYEPDNDPRAFQGMHYCHYQNNYVYGCDHEECN